MSTFCQHLYHRKCQRRGVAGQKKPKSCQHSLWTPRFWLFLTTFFQQLYHRKCKCRGVGGQEKPKSCHCSLWTTPKSQKYFNLSLHHLREIFAPENAYTFQDFAAPMTRPPVRENPKLFKWWNWTPSKSYKEVRSADKEKKVVYLQSSWTRNWKFTC